MNSELLILGEQQDDYLEHVSCPIRSDDEDLRWIGVRIEVDHGDRMFDGVPDVFVVDAVPSSRLVGLHTRLV